MKLLKKILVIFVSVNLLLVTCYLLPVRADEIDDIQKQIDDLAKQLQMSEAATAPLQAQIDKADAQITQIQAQIDSHTKTIQAKDIELKNLNEEIAKKDKDLSFQKDLFDRTVRASYIRGQSDFPMEILLSSKDAVEATRELAYRNAVAQQDRGVILSISNDLKDLADKKQKAQDLEAYLKKEKVRLASVQDQINKQTAFIRGEVAKARDWQKNLNQQIATLTAKQQEIITEKLGSLNIPLYAYNTQSGCSSDINPYVSPGFSPAFGFFTYGVPNRVGLNQYGAFGRSKVGQNYQDILRAYYNFDSIEQRSAQINVEGYGSYALDDYVKRIYEVPNSWGDQGGMEALKAQAIAARSYALAYTNNGSGSICTTQQCQVFQPDPKGGNWEQAVNATAGQVMVQGGQPIKAWFSSTHGGYIHSSAAIGWNSTSWTKNAVDSPSTIGSFSDLQSNAYDKDSPWFYCDWGARSQYNKTAWLKSEEVADYANVILLSRLDSSTKVHLYQTDKSNPEGQENWDAERVKQELRSRGGNPFNNVSDISIGADFGSGITTSVTVSGDAGSQSFGGSEFKDWFNLRAPANIQIVGPLYNIEKK